MSVSRLHGLFRLVLWMSLLLAIFTSHVHAQYVHKVIVKSGDPVPGTAGAIFNTTDWSPPISIGISLAGDVLFKAMLEDGVGDVTPDNINGLWAYDHRLDTVRLVFRHGLQVSGLSGATFVEFDEQHTSIDISGQIGLYASYSIAGVEEFAFFMEARGTSGNGTLLRKVYEGMELLPAIPGATIRRFTPVAFNNGRLLFTASLLGPAINEGFDDLVMCIYDPTGITVIARKGDPMPSVGNGYIIGNVSSNTESAPLDIHGNAIIQIVGVKFQEPDIRAAFIWIPTNDLFPLALSHKDTTSIILGDSRLNSFGSIARRGYTELNVSNTLIASGPIASGGNDTVAIEGTPAVGAGGATFALFRDFVIFDDDQVAVQAFLSDGKAGIWIGDKTGLAKVALAGDRAPGLDTSMRFTYVNGMMANRVGEIAFSSFADNGVFGFDGIWVGGAGGLVPVSLSDQFVIDNAVPIGIVDAHFAGHTYWTRTGADGHSALLNDSGKIAYGVTFQGGGNALLLGSPGGLIVNSNADLPDIDPGNGRCDTGRKLPDGRPECTLRAAIAEANAQSGPDLITFDIEGDTKISPQTDLPDIEDSVLIDATTQPGPDKIELAGGAPGLSSGLTITGQGITIKGLTIGDFPTSGIFIDGGGGHNEIYGCIIGHTGGFGFGGGNGGDGIYVKNSSRNSIGGSEPWQSNKISHNGLCGIALDAGSMYNRILGNQIGLTYNQFNSPNTDCGILIQNMSDSNVVGGASNSMNHIRGNGGDGIRIVGSDLSRIEGNVVTDNRNGVSVEGQSVDTRITGNRIGIDRDGLADGNRHFGVRIAGGSEDNAIGLKSDERNIISANDSGGIQIVSSNFNQVSNNYIGTNADGSEAMSNRGHGIRITDCFNTVIGQGSFFGVTFGQGNLISGNDSAGVAVDGGSVNTVIASNLIGVAADSVSSMGNYSGITTFLSDYTFIGHGGSLLSDMGNIIGYNTSVGIRLASDTCSVISNQIFENGSIGTLIRGDGIYVDGSDNLIGLPERENAMFFNDGAGVFVDFGVFDNISNRIEYNFFGQNGGGGIDLAPVGFDQRDSLDLDSGPNDSQNSPLLVSATLSPGDVLSIQGVLHSTPNQAYHVLVYSDRECASLVELRQGSMVIWEDTVITDANGDAQIDISEGPWHPPFPDAVTMIVTDPFGNTSEFSNCLFVVDLLAGVDLVVTKTDRADTVRIGDTLRYEITVANYGTDPANNVSLTDSLPSFVTYEADSSTQGSCVFVNGVLMCNLGVLASSQTATVYLAGVSNSLGVIENRVWVGSSELDVDLSSNVAVDSTISSDVGTGIAGSGEHETLPLRFALAQNYPNPFNPSTTFEYSLPVSARVSLTIFNILGREIRTLGRSEQPAGYHTILWDGLDESGSRVSSGVYFYRLAAGPYSHTRKMVLLK